ncbi:hypothetical protein DRQ32_02540, partial [bacterium]
ILLIVVSSIAFGMASGIAASPPETQTDYSASGVPLRLISLNPSLTAIVLRLGAGDSLVGVDDGVQSAMDADPALLEKLKAMGYVH